MEEKEWQPIRRKHNWLKKISRDMFFEIKVFDNNRSIDRFLFNTTDNFKKILEIIRLKYGLNYK